MKKDFYFPDYYGGSIVNLMSSVGKACGWNSKYSELKLLSSEEIKKYKNIVLVIIDGLGYEYLKSKPKSFLYEKTRGKITSSFLATTSASNTVFLTGVPAQQHAYPAWHTLFKEIGIVSIALMFMPRLKGMPYSKKGVNIKEIFDEKAFPDKIKRKSINVVFKPIANSDFTNAANGKSKKITYNPNLTSFFKQLNKAIKLPGKKYIHTYWPKFDSYAHDQGIASKKVAKHFNELDRRVKTFAKNIPKDTIVLITADHGLIDVPMKNRIRIEDHPKLEECLTLPLCGEGRVPFCYVHPSKTKQFEKYIKTKFKKYCTLHKGQDLIDKNYFGLGKPHPKLFDRIGDYVLITKKNYYIGDKLAGQEYNSNKGHHGGLSKQEMLVPLIVLKK